MRDTPQLNNIELWRSRLGLLPVPLFGTTDSKEQYVLLNGSKGNFCLDFSEEDIGTERRNRAWSSNVGHYVSLVHNKYVEIQSWGRNPSSIERYSYESVSSNLEGFHDYLVKDEPKSTASVIAHVIRVFRSVRASLEQQQIGGFQSMKAFLYLLACATDGVARNALSTQRWGLDSEAREIAELIPASGWRALEAELTDERLLENLTLRLDLMLRHASGQVFQEAHHEAIFKDSSQLMFEGFIPAPVKVEKHGEGIGIHFTPPALARTLVEEALAAFEQLPQHSIHVFDPACGSGEFLRETLRQLALRGYGGNILLEGWDISSAACDMAKFTLAWEAREYSNQVKVRIRCVDSLNTTSQWPRDVDLILMNPPFLSWQEMSGEQRQEVKTILGDVFNKQPDMSNVFLWKAASCLRTGGVVGSILPASFLNGIATARMRAALGEFISTELVARLGSHLLFPNALIDAALYLGRAEAGKVNSPLVFWADYRATSTADGLRSLRRVRYAPKDVVLPVVKEGYSIYRNPEIGKGSESWAPRPYRAWEFLRRVEHLSKVHELFHVRKGAQTGHNESLVLDKEQWEGLPKRERRFFRPAVVNKSIRYGFLTDAAYVFYPYGESAIETEDDLKRLVPTYFSRVLNKNKGVLRRRTGITASQWWLLRRHLPWQVEYTPKLVSTFFGDAGSFAWDDTGAYVVLQGNSWLLHNTESISIMPANIGLAYLAILNSPVFSELLAAKCNHVGGGQWDLSKRFVNEIPLPNLMGEHVNPDLISKLANVGKRIHGGHPINDKELDELVRVIYLSGQML